MAWPSAPHSDRWTRLRHLKQFDDFRWLVRDGYRKINDYPLAHEAYRFQIANLTELLAQAEKGARRCREGRYLEKVSELEDIRAELSGWSIWKTDNLSLPGRAGQDTAPGATA